MRLIGIALLLVFAAPSMTFATPANLIDKTVSVSMTTSAPWISSDGKTGFGSRNTTITIYISSAGRVFSRTVRNDGKAGVSATKERAPGESAWRVAGDKLVGNGSHVSGATQTTVSFDPSGQSCTATVLFGRDAGRALQWKGVDGITYTATGPWVASNLRCSVASGNAFAG